MFGTFALGSSAVLTGVTCPPNPTAFHTDCTYTHGFNYCAPNQITLMLCNGVREGGLFGVYAGFVGGGTTYIRLSNPLRRLEMRFEHTTTWGTICDSGFMLPGNAGKLTAQRICSWFGWQSDGSWFTAGGGSGSVYFDHLMCGLYYAAYLYPGPAPGCTYRSGTQRRLSAQPRRRSALPRRLRVAS